MASRITRQQTFMSDQREDMTPDECKQRYDEYKADYMQRLAQSFFDVHRTEVGDMGHVKEVSSSKEARVVDVKKRVFLLKAWLRI